MRYSERQREGLRLPSRDDLKYFQAMPLDIKVAMTKTRIREWVKEYGTDGVYVSFSGGKDSTVLLHIVRELYPNIEAVFVDTGLEYPEIRKFVKTFENVTILRPNIEQCMSNRFPNELPCKAGVLEWLNSEVEK